MTVLTDTMCVNDEPEHVMIILENMCRRMVRIT